VKRLYKSLDESIGFFTNQTNKNIIRFLSSHLKQYEVTPEQWTVLKKLAEQDGISQKELAIKVDKDQPTLTRILDILERKELINKQINKDDRRSFLLYLTDNGISLKEELIPVIESLFERLLQGIPEEKLRVFNQVLEKINSNAVLD
jgi:MarR family transcriptional regulator, transcriptional regulator for hemolysin